VVEVEVEESGYQYTGIPAVWPPVFAAAAVPDGAVLDGVVLDGVVPDGVVREGVVREGVVPDGVVREGVVPDGAVPDGAVPDGAVLGGEVPDRVDFEARPLVAGRDVAETGRCRSKGVADANGRDVNHPPVRAATATATATAAATATVNSPRGTDRSVGPVPGASSTDGAVSPARPWRRVRQTRRTRPPRRPSWPGAVLPIVGAFPPSHSAEWPGDADGVWRG
jgi:hypothetical protein